MQLCRRDPRVLGSWFVAARAGGLSDAPAVGGAARGVRGPLWGVQAAHTCAVSEGTRRPGSLTALALRNVAPARPRALRPSRVASVPPVWGSWE